ncbi:hypothetical protein JRW43_000377 [Vibrio cholerae]|nr:hypothetical protein [Vibrio cholerae]EJN2400235.1 hypothetical protein [Vibrio cholerae]
MLMIQERMSPIINCVRRNLTEPYSTLQRSVVLIPLVLWSRPSLSSDYVVYKVDENHYKVKVDVNNPAYYTAWDISSDANPAKNSIRPKYFGTVPGHGFLVSAGTGECVQTEVFTKAAFIDTNHVDHARAIRTVLNKVNSCTFEYREIIHGPPAWGELILEIGVSDTGYKPRLWLGPGSLESEPNQCSVSLDDMDFGLITHNTMPIKTIDLLISCSRDADINIKTNNGRLFVDPASGTEIEFIDPPPFALSSCSKNCIVNIEGRMKKTPNTKGSYKWFVPVVVEYL